MNASGKILVIGSSADTFTCLPRKAGSAQLYSVRDASVDVRIVASAVRTFGDGA